MADLSKFHDRLSELTERMGIYLKRVRDEGLDASELARRQLGCEMVASCGRSRGYVCVCGGSGCARYVVIHADGCPLR